MGRELCWDGRFYGDGQKRIEKGKQGAVWIEMENDTLGFLDLAVGINEATTEEYLHIALPEFEEVVESDERAMVRKVRLDWEGLCSSRYFENVGQFRTRNKWAQARLIIS